MKQLTIATFAALMSLSSLSHAANITIAEDHTDIVTAGQTYSKTIDLSSFGPLSGITLGIEAAGDYDWENEIITFKMDDYIIAEWSSETAPSAVENPNDPTMNFYTLSGFFDESTQIGSTTFGDIWAAASADNSITLSWSNTYEVEDMTASSAGAGQLDDYVRYSLQAAPVPEPSTYALMLAGLGLVGFMANRRKKA